MLQLPRPADGECDLPCPAGPHTLPAGLAETCKSLGCSLPEVLAAAFAAQLVRYGVSAMFAADILEDDVRGSVRAAQPIPDADSGVTMGQLAAALSPLGPDAAAGAAAHGAGTSKLPSVAFALANAAPALASTTGGGGQTCG